MKQKQPENKERRFEMNGGYFIDGIPYMDCKITGDPVRNVSVETTSVIGSRALMARVDKMFPEQTKPKRVKTGRPSGWHFMSEFVDKDGTVFHKGKEQPNLKGTLQPTKIDRTPKKKLSKQEKQDLKDQIIQQMAMVRGQLKNAKWKKDIKSGNSQLKKLERRLKKIR